MLFSNRVSFAMSDCRFGHGWRGLLELVIASGSIAQACRQRLIFVQVETMKLPVLSLLVTKARFRAGHDTVTGWLQFMPMATHPTLLSAWVSYDQGIVWDVIGDYGAGGDEGVAANCDTAENRGIGPNSSAASDNRLLVETSPADLRARV